jgi:beta-phosphoglucomutase-like phosphatase (HAD superfamily)
LFPVPCPWRARSPTLGWPSGRLLLRCSCSRASLLRESALDLAWVADGRLNASITLSNKPWDTSAGVLIAREAGATVTDAHGNPHDLNSAATIAAAPALISQLIPLI